MCIRDHLRLQLLPPKRGIEIGPSYRPIAAKRDGYDVIVVDHDTAENLRLKYQEIESIHNIETVDIIWRSGAFHEAINASHGSFDYIIASHVIEHLPDPLSFLISCEKLLRENGSVELFIPDKRRTFDYVKPCLDISTVLERYREKRTKHGFATIFFAYNDHVINDGRGDWGFMPVQSIELAACNPLNALEVAQKALESNQYFDVHANIFTPASFMLIILTLRYLGLLALAPQEDPKSDGCEFYVQLKKPQPSQKAITFDEYRASKELLRLRIFDEMQEQLDILKQSEVWRRYEMTKASR